jgi:serine/threonine protein kinase
MYRMGPYTLSERIGAGGMAEVWMAHRISAGAKKTLAVKLLAPNLASMQKYREMFLAEARLSMLLNHSNIVQVFDAGEECGECYMAMEWVDGANLAELQAALWEMGRAMPVEVAMYIVGEVLRALDYAHNLVHDGAATIIHRDVSPANIMLSMAGEVKLTDFGVARFGTEETSGMHVKGKLRYMAPEQLRGSSKSGTVDIFSIGAVLHEMLEGSKFRGGIKDEGELIQTAFEGLMPELAGASPIVPELDSLRQRMLASEVNERVASAREALQMLRQCPGYRQAAHELEALVRWYRGTDMYAVAHRSGTHGQFGSAMPNGQGSDTSISRLLPPAGSPRPAWSRGQAGDSRRRRRAAAVLIAFCGLALGCFSISYGVSAMDVETQPSVAEVVEPEVETIPAAEVRPEEPQLPLPRAKIEEPDVVAELSPEPAVEQPKATASDKNDSKPKPKVKPGHVKFLAGDLFTVYVKVGGKQKIAGPKVEVTLPPGTHKIYARRDPKQKWELWGQVQVDSGQHKTVQFVKPKGIKLLP